MAEAGGRGRGRDLASAGDNACEGATGVATLGRAWSGTLGMPGTGIRDCFLTKAKNGSKKLKRF